MTAQTRPNKDNTNRNSNIVEEISQDPTLRQRTLGD